MASRPKKLPKNSRDLSPRQWAWEFLRFNPAYRAAYSEWMSLPLSVRDLKRTGGGMPLLACPPETSMSLFFSQPAALNGETVGDWIIRTEESRRERWSIGHAPSVTPQARFGISKWIDPETTPLPNADENIFGRLAVDVFADLNDREHPRHKPLAITVADIKKSEVVVKIDVLHPLGFLNESIRQIVLKQRELLQKIGISSLHLYEGAKSFNPAGVYESYVKILQRINNGESKSEIIHVTPDGEHVDSDHSYAVRTKKQYPVALALRDEGYRHIAYYEDFIGQLRGA